MFSLLSLQSETWMPHPAPAYLFPQGAGGAAGRPTSSSSSSGCKGAAVGSRAAPWALSLMQCDASRLFLSLLLSTTSSGAGCCPPGPLLTLSRSLSRYPFGADSPAFLICGSSSSSIDAAALDCKGAKRLPDFCFSVSATSSSMDGGSDGCAGGSNASSNDGSAGSSSGSSVRRRRALRPDIGLGLALDKQLCFYGDTSVAVLGDAPGGLQLALAALTVMMRETHRSSKSTVLWQLSQLQGCPLVPQPPPGSYLLQLIRVPRPLQLPSPRYKMLLSDAECSAASLKHAVVWHLSHGLGCTQVLVRGPEGVATALQALARARNTLLKLYRQDCVVYLAWKPQPPAAGAAGDPRDTAAAGDAGDAAAGGSAAGDGAAAGHNSGRVGHTPSSSASMQQEQEQQMASDQSSVGAEDEAAAIQQSEVQAVLPPRLYKLVIMACDVSDPLSGWRHLSPHRRSRQALLQQQAWLAKAQARQQERQQQRQAEAQTRQQERQRQRQAQARQQAQLRWFRPIRNRGASPDCLPP